MEIGAIGVTNYARALPFVRPLCYFRVSSVFDKHTRI